MKEQRKESVRTQLKNLEFLNQYPVSPLVFYRFFIVRFGISCKVRLESFHIIYPFFAPPNKNKKPNYFFTTVSQNQKLVLHSSVGSYFLEHVSPPKKECFFTLFIYHS